MGRPKQLIREIHRRSLWQVLAIYLVASWVVYQVVQGLTEGLRLPEWFPALAVVLLLTGLPIVLATAFVQEGVPAFTRDDPTLLPHAEPSQRVAGTRAEPARVRRIFTWGNAILGGVLAFALWGVFAAGWLLFAREEVITRAEVAAVAGIANPTLGVESDPTGATVTVRSVAADSSLEIGDSRAIGVTPIAEHELRAGEYLLTVAAAGFNPLDRLVRLDSGEHLTLSHRLVPLRAGTEGMVFVAEGVSAESKGDDVVPSFLIDRHEVSNEEYLSFVAAGGYENPDYWPGTLIIDGERVPRSEARARLVDRTGMPGPRGWSGGIYPEGKSSHPVVGVSWYEASAFARWAGKQLPTWNQWWRAARAGSGGPFPWGSSQEDVGVRANVGLIDTEPVGSHPLGVSPVGAHDMAGNVAEWLRDSDDPGAQVVVGGSWKNPVYGFDPNNAWLRPPEFADDGIGFRCVRNQEP